MDHEFKTLFFPIRWVCSCGVRFQPEVTGVLAHSAQVAEAMHAAHVEEVAQQG